MSEVALYNGLTQDQLFAAMGVQQDSANEQGSNRLPILKINYQEEDDKGNELKKGAFALTLPSGTVYGKDVRVRVFSDYMQYLDYDPAQEAVVNKTIIHRGGDEPIDEKGGIRCGKPTSNALREMGDDIREKYKSITCFRYLYAKVSISDAATADGTAVEVKDEPCLFRMKGASFLAFNSVTESCRAQKLKFLEVESAVTTERQKKGSVTYFTTKFEPDFSNIIPITSDDLHFMSKILDTVNFENKQVMAKYNEALRNSQEDVRDEKLVGEVEEYLDDFDETA